MNCYYCKKPGAKLMTGIVECEFCDGSGEGYDDFDSWCLFCDGKGDVEEQLGYFCDSQCMREYYIENDESG